MLECYAAATPLLLIILALQWAAATTLAEPIKGVNLGGWFVTEQWITPSLYESTNAADEWNLCNLLGKQKCLSTLQQHWKGFYSRNDFNDIRKAGLNTVRIPLGFWAVDILDREPYVSGQYPYLIQAVQWAREFNLSVYVDLHGAPGSQNGQDNSGLIGPVLFATNTSNSDRSLNVLRNLTEEFPQPQYGDTVVGIELLNEPRVGSARFSMDQLKKFYADGVSEVHNSSEEGLLNVTIHDAFWGPQYWIDYNPADSTSNEPATSLTVDTHQYYAFAPLDNLTQSQIIDAICNTGKTLKNPSSGIPPTVVGEWSLQTSVS
ncbi:hypothetical protein LTR86_008387 [Recurvomyces mirabilis]|nr:hypothetical protein LTR86_008387 [Recurvomyces mirabilis]